jgi:hypothetical protein
MTDLGESDLRALLYDPRLPTVERAYRNPGFRHVLVWRMLALAEVRLGNKPDLEQTLDALVEQVGGERLNVLDPWRWLPDLARRMGGKLLPPRDDVYAIPEGFYSG